MSEDVTPYLLQCPCCGSDNIDPSYMVGEDDAGNDADMPGCQNCGLCAPTLAAWNRRSPYSSDAQRRAIQAELLQAADLQARLSDALAEREELSRLLVDRAGERDRWRWCLRDIEAALLMMERTETPDSRPIVDRIHELRGEFAGLRQDTAALETRGDRYLAAIRWALGTHGIFRARREGEGVYWWRRELAHRACLAYWPSEEQYVEAGGEPVGDSHPAGPPQQPHVRARGGDRTGT